jgi:preprotein translocase subunit YajC
MVFAADPPQTDAPSWAPIVPLLIMGVLFIFIMGRSKRSEQSQRNQLLANLKKNDKVLTSGGIIGMVALINDKEDEVTLKVDESSNVRIRVLKSSIIKNYTSDEAAREQAAKDKAAKDGKTGKGTDEAFTAAKK